MIGQSLGKYKIEGLLGEGGMGAVYLARDRDLHRPVALKVMHPAFAQQPTFRARFQQEARAAARLDHPGIVKVYDLGQTETLLYIVMEYVDGPTLQVKLAELQHQGRQLSLAEALRLCGQLAAAMNYVHAQGVLHRDLKPDNILLKANPQASPAALLPYQPVITDLGLAKLQEGGLMTMTGMQVAGTPAYMSPEQAQGQLVDARSDVYALGLILYELTVGQPPFPIKSLTDAVHYHVFRAPPPPRSLQPDLPAAVEKVILTALAKEPRDRYPTAGAFAQALAALSSALLATDKNASAYPPTLPYLPEPPRPLRSRWLSLGLVATLALLVVIAALLFANRGGSGNPALPATAIGVAEGAVATDTPTQPSATVDSSQNAVVVATPTLVLATPVDTATASVPMLTPMPTSQPTSLPTSLPIPMATAPPTAPPAPTSTSLPPVLAAPFARPAANGLLIASHVGADSASGVIVIDGQADDWQRLQANLGLQPSTMIQVYNNGKSNGCAALHPAGGSATDLAGIVRFAYDATYLYVSFTIEDDGFVPNPDPMYHWRGDAPQLLLDMQLADDFSVDSNNGDEFQVDLLPGHTAIGDAATAAFWPLAQQDVVRVFAEAQVAASPITTGYFLEAALPWQSFGGFQPAAGVTLGIAPGVSENDTPTVLLQECMLSAAPQRLWGKPSTWATLLLQ